MPGAAAIAIDHVLEIEAPAERVWAVITDLDAYPSVEPVRGGLPVDARGR